MSFLSLLDYLIIKTFLYLKSSRRIFLKGTILREVFAEVKVEVIITALRYYRYNNFERYFI